MGQFEDGVSRHYGAYNVLEEIRNGIRAMQLDPDHVLPETLKPVDEFHIGGGEATSALLEKLALTREMSVLDIGCGIGGLARMVAQRFGCRVTGIDLTPEFVEAAQRLTEMCGMAGKVSFTRGSATALPLPDQSFDIAVLLHVGMNIADKAAIFREARRVLKSDGTFAVYDVMRTGDCDLEFPVPWAERPELSALEPAETYREAARSAGFSLVSEEDKSAIALDFFAKIRAQAEGVQPAPLGLHNLMGPTIREKTANMIAAIRNGTIAPTEMIFRTTAS